MKIMICLCKFSQGPFNLAVPRWWEGTCRTFHLYFETGLISYRNKWLADYLPCCNTAVIKISEASKMCFQQKSTGKWCRKAGSGQCCRQHKPHALQRTLSQTKCGKYITIKLTTQLPNNILCQSQGCKAQWKVNHITNFTKNASHMCFSKQNCFWRQENSTPYARVSLSLHRYLEVRDKNVANIIYRTRSRQIDGFQHLFQHVGNQNRIHGTHARANMVKTLLVFCVVAWCCLCWWWSEWW